MDCSETDSSIRLRFDFYKSVVTFALASLGGEITLLHTLFADSDHQFLAYVSIGLTIFACILVLGAKEALVRRISPIPDFQNRLLKSIGGLAVLSLKGEWTLSFFAGIAFGFGLVLFGIFVVLA